MIDLRFRFKRESSATRQRAPVASFSPIPIAKSCYKSRNLDGVGTLSHPLRRHLPWQFSYLIGYTAVISFHSNPLDWHAPCSESVGLAAETLFAVRKPQLPVRITVMQESRQVKPVHRPRASAKGLRK